MKKKKTKKKKKNIKKKIVKNKVIKKSKEVLQNMLFKTHAESEIGRMSYEEKQQKVKELKKIGYEYNSGIHIISEEDIIIPYDFILFCLLIDNLRDTMIEKKIKITNKDGIHMRPAMHIIDIANKYKSDVIIEKNGEQADAKSIMEVTMLAIGAEDEITIKVKGEDDIEALNAIEELIINDFNDVEKIKKKDKEPNEETIKTFEETDRDKELTICNSIEEMLIKLDDEGDEEKNK